MVEDADQQWVISFATDLVGESDVEADDEQVPADEGKDSGEAHAHRQELILLRPPEVDHDDGSIQQFAESVGHNMSQNMSPLAIFHHHCYYLYIIITTKDR